MKMKNPSFSCTGDHAGTCASALGRLWNSIRIATPQESLLQPTKTRANEFGTETPTIELLEKAKDQLQAFSEMKEIQHTRTKQK